MSAHKEYSPEARQLSIDLLRVSLEAVTAHPNDEPAATAASNAARDQLVCQLVDRHGYARTKVIYRDAAELALWVLERASAHFGWEWPPAA